MAVLYRGNRGGGTQSGSGGHTVTVPVTRDCTPGEMILLLLGVGNGNDAKDAYDSKGNVWAVDLTNISGTGYILFCSSVLSQPLRGGIDSISLYSPDTTVSGDLAWTVEAFANVATVSRRDQNALGFSATTALSMTAPTPALAQADELVVAAWTKNAPEVSFTPGGGMTAFTLRSIAGLALMSEFQIVASTAGVSPTGTMGTAASNNGATLTYKGGGGTPQELAVAPGLLTR